MMWLSELLEKSTSAALQQQASDGTMPAGHNGPYHDPQTPVRNTGHWAITFLKVYNNTGERKYLDASYQAIRYLLSREARPDGFAFWHRKKLHKDATNGIIGQAWTIEAFAMVADGLEMPELIVEAEKLFLLHAFDYDQGVWHRIGLDGKLKPVDSTFNHQLWFAAAGGLLKHNGDISSEVEVFLDKLESNNLVLYGSGLIKHPLLSKNGRLIHKYLKTQVRMLIKNKQMAYKSVGYHQFNLYAFAMLKMSFPSHPFWRSEKFKKILAYAVTDQYKQLVEDNIYAYPYNPPGFEMTFALQVFDEKLAESDNQQWLSKQVGHCYNFDTWAMNRNTEDPDTLNARLYEATRLNDIFIKIDSNKS